jgi:GNAT superfamily N-acetyltransferase
VLPEYTGVLHLTVARAAVDRVWAATFGSDPADLRTTGVRAVGDAPGLGGYQGLFLLRLGDGLTIGAPANRADDVRARAAGRTADELFSRDAARELAGPDAGLVLGPSVHAYVDGSMFVPQEPCDARPLGPDADTILEPLREAVTAEEWAEGGFGPPLEGQLWAAFEDGRVVAAANLTENFGHVPGDVGVVTHPDHRGRGVATRLVGAMVADALLTLSPVVRYRALATNLASRAVCRKLGFVDDGANIAVRLLQE